MSMLANNRPNGIAQVLSGAPLACVGAPPGAVVGLGLVPGTAGEVGPVTPGSCGVVAPVPHVAGGFSNAAMRMGPLVVT
jgi:hypothetical protein